MGWIRHGCIWLVGLVVSSSPVRGGVISELCPAGRWAADLEGQVVWVPEHVEVCGLSEEGPVELVIIDASVSPSRYGRIVQVLRLACDPATGRGPEVRVGAGAGWAEMMERFVGRAPAGAWTFWPGGLNTALVNAAGALQARSLMLFDRPTDLSVAHGSIRQAGWGQAQLLDVVTIAPVGGLARAWRDEPIVQMNPRMVLVRPQCGDVWDKATYYRDGWPEWGGYLVCVPTVNGQLTEVAPGYPGLNPGALNPIWTGHVPEPAGAMLIVGMAAQLVLTRKVLGR